MENCPPAAFDLAFAFKVISLVVALYGIICGIVMWFLPIFTLSGFTTGIALIVLNALIGLAELRPDILIKKYFVFLGDSLGRGLYLILIGLFFAGPGGLWIATWVIFWLLGTVYVVLYFTKADVGPNQGFKEVSGGEPLSTQGRTGDLSGPQHRFNDSFNQPE
jgi:hypothetical protein